MQFCNYRFFLSQHSFAWMRMMWSSITNMLLRIYLIDNWRKSLSLCKFMNLHTFCSNCFYFYVNRGIFVWALEKNVLLVASILHINPKIQFKTMCKSLRFEVVLALHPTCCDHLNAKYHKLIFAFREERNCCNILPVKTWREGWNVTAVRHREKDVFNRWPFVMKQLTKSERRCS